MSVFYLFAILPIIVGLFLFLTRNEVNWWEYAISSGSALLLCVIFHAIAVESQTGDTETWSGQIDHATYYPRWREEYQEAHTQTHTSGSGKNARTWTTTYYTTEHRWHGPDWTAFDTIGGWHSIDEGFYNQICTNFNDRETQWESKSGFDMGDHNIYPSFNKTGYLYPVNSTRTFENRIKNTTTLFGFAKVDPSAKVFDYPNNPDWQVSNRLLGNPPIPIRDWDMLNSRLGPAKKVNLILVKFPPNQAAAIAQQQQAKWIGGKKNDLVLCYAEDGGKTLWSVVFGWTEAELVKRNLETLLLENHVDTKLIPAIEQEVRANFTKKNWHKFDYIAVQPPTWCVVTCGVVMLITQVGLWIWIFVNRQDKDIPRRRYA